MATLRIKNINWDEKYPCELVMGNGGRKSFIPPVVDFENRQAWHQIGQASDNGEWIEFDDIQFDNKEVQDLIQKVINEAHRGSEAREKLEELRLSIVPTEKIINGFADLFRDYKKDMHLKENNVELLEALKDVANMCKDHLEKGLEFNAIEVMQNVESAIELTKK